MFYISITIIGLMNLYKKSFTDTGIRLLEWKKEEERKYWIERSLSVNLKKFKEVMENIKAHGILI